MSALQELQSLLASAEAHLKNGEHQAGAAAAEAALSAAERLGHRAGEAEALATLAQHELRLGNPEVAVAQGHRALLLMRGRRDVRARTTLLCAMVLACTEMQLGSDALEYAVQAIGTAKTTNDALLMSWALNRTALAHKSLDEPERGTPMLEEAFRLAQQARGRDETFSAANNLCSNLLECATRLQGPAREQALKRAISVGAQALSFAKHAANTSQECTVEHNLANAYRQLGRYDQALAHVAREETIALSEGYRAMVVYARWNRAELERHRGALPLAISWFERALSASHEAADDAVLLLIHRGLYECHQQLRHFESALRHHKEMHALERVRLVQRADRQARMLLNRVDLEHAKAAAERARLDTEVERLRAAALESQNVKLTMQVEASEKDALQDALTGVANRRHMDRELPTRLAEAQASKSPLCIALVDLDHFKTVNDTYGHGVGDEVLRGVAALFLEHVRSTDLVARLGGEEFLLIFDRQSLADAQEASERLCSAVAAHDFSHVASGLRVTVSIGLCQAPPDLDSQALLTRVDELLYEAKRGGRNRVVTCCAHHRHIPSVSTAISRAPSGN